MAPSFKEILKEKDFFWSFELIPGRSVRTRHYQEILKFLEVCAKRRDILIFSITDNAGGNPALSPLPLGKTIKEFGLEPLIHFSCKDKNRNQIESELLALDREGLHNLLVLTGDYPFYGYLGKAKPVYDLDSVILLKMITNLEKGNTFPPIPFFKGAVVNPFKITPLELIWQYLKLYKKIKAGAYFFITQVGFFPKKWQELKALFNLGLTQFFSQILKEKNLHNPEEDEKIKKLPLIGSLLLLNPKLLVAIKKAKIPGIILTTDILKYFEEKSFSDWEGKGDSFEEKAINLCAKQAVILKRLGYKGVHLCGFPLNYNILDRFFERFSFYEAKGEDFLEEFGGEYVIETLDKTYKGKIASSEKEFFYLEDKGFKGIFYYLNESFHRLFFEEKSPFYPFFKKLISFIERAKVLKNLFTSFEYFIKKFLFNCQECGDCTLWNFNYRCPQSGCAKYLLNGPCGGSISGYCEVYPFVKKCHYVKSFKKGLNLKVFLFLPPLDWAFYKTSSWINFYLERGHFNKSLKNL